MSSEGPWRIAGAVALFLLLLTAPVHADRAQLEDDLAQMLEWFGGRFDNYWQARQDEAEEVEHPHGRIHSIFAPVDFPQLGEHVYYVQQYSDGDPAKIYRQRLYRFAINEEKGVVELVIYAPPDTTAVVDAHLDSSKLAGLEVEDLRSYPGCEVAWTRHNRGGEDDHFLGIVPKGACQVESRRSGRTLIIMDDLRLDSRQIWIQDRAVDTEGNWVYGNRAGVPHKLNRVRWFDCWAAAPKNEAELAAERQASEGEEGKELDEWHLWRPIRLHDQGGSYQLSRGPEGPQQSVELFQAVYKGRSEVPVLEIAIREQGQERSIAYAWANPESRRLGINLRSVQVGCTLDAE